MENTIFYLSTCDTCRRIMKQINDLSQFELVDVKKEHISSEQLELLSSLSSLRYEELFNKRAQKFKGIDRTALSETDYKRMILEEYTFLKRPIIVYNQDVFVGNSKSVVAAAVSAIN